MLLQTVLARADALDDYGRICREPAARTCKALQQEDRRAACDAEQILTSACTEFLAHLDRDASPTREGRLAQIRALHWVHQLRDDLNDEVERALCAQRRALVQDHPGYAPAWYELTRCAADHAERVTFLRQALVIEPTNARALDFLTLLTSDGNRYGIDSEALVRYQTTGYETTSDPRMKITYAARIHKTSLESGDVDAARSIRDRLRREVLEVLDYTGEHRAESVDLACAALDVGLEEVCTAAFESLAHGAALTDDVLRLIPGVLDAFSHVLDSTELILGRDPLPISRAVRDQYLARLKRVMDAQPAGWRTSKYYEVYAQFHDGPKRRSLLRQAVETDPGNADATCTLAAELVRSRAYVEALRLYEDMASRGDRGGWCDVEKELHDVRSAQEMVAGEGR